MLSSKDFQDRINIIDKKIAENKDHEAVLQQQILDLRTVAQYLFQQKQDIIKNSESNQNNILKITYFN